MHTLIPVSYTLEQALLVMPAMNEEAVISSTIAEVKRVLPDVNILVVDDGSSDRTAELAREAGVRVLSLPFNLGVGGAMRLGFRYAAMHGFPVMVQLDSDGQHDPADVPDLVGLLGKTDVAIGARFAGVGEYQVRGPRSWAMRMLSGILSRFVGARLTDTTSGFKAHGPRAIEVYKKDFPAEYLGDTVEALVIGHRAGLAFEQLPVAMRERAGGTPSQSTLRSTIYLGRALVALALAMMRPRVK